MKLQTLLLTFLGILLSGTLGYHFIEGWDYFDAFYMTAITITTVGFGEVYPLSTGGRVFTLIVLFAGFGVAFTALSHIAASFLRGEIQQAFGRRRMEKDLKLMSGHYIICGHGRMGKVIAKEFARKNVPFVVIEMIASELTRRSEDQEFPFITGDASDEETLRLAGVERALGIVTVVSTDAENAFITLTAKQLNPHLRMVSRANDLSSVSKLKLAGATKVISPYIIGGTRIAQAILNPGLVDFIDNATDNDSVDVEMAEVAIHPHCIFDGITLDHADIKSLDVIIVSIHRSHQNMFKPAAKTVLEGGDRLIAVGKPEQIQKMIERSASKI